MNGFKKSEFNYIVEKENCVLIYNTLYSSLTRLDYDEYDHYMNLDFENKDEKKDFLNQGIIVRKDINELERYNIFSAFASKYNKSIPTITITPTMACNASCFYCYEEGVRCGRMSKLQVQNIIKTIQKLNLEKGISITWFGGEPLLNQEWMDQFSDCLRKENIEFSAFLISNGSLIDHKVVKKMLNNWNVKCIQISMDGDSIEYQTRKAYYNQDENIYYKVLFSIKEISKAGITVQVRLNIDRDNIDSILNLVNDIEVLFKRNSNVSIYPAFLTGSPIPLTEHEKIDIIKRIIKVDIHNKLSIDKYLYKIPKSSACKYFTNKDLSIDVKGDIFRCERLLGHREKSIGNIEQESDMNINNELLSGRRTECQKCVFLPKCHGGCQEAYENGESPCFIEKYAIKAYLDIL